MENNYKESGSLTPEEIRGFMKKHNLRSGDEHTPTGYPIPQPVPVLEDEDLLTDVLESTPTIPDEVYANLPDLITKIINTVVTIEKSEEWKRERDMLMIGTLIILSGCFPEVFGIYGPEVLSPHLYSFIIAPPANSKGVLKVLKTLLQLVQCKLKNQFLDDWNDYETKMKEHAQKLKNDEIKELPILKVPRYYRLLTPGDSSYAALINFLNDNDGKGIMIENEADSMGDTNGQIWGKYGTILRLAFHHETISKERVSSIPIEIINPKLAVLLSGTPGQVPNIIHSAENGLFSRFIFYLFKNDPKWKNPLSQKPYDGKYINNLSEELLAMMKFLNEFPTEVRLTEKQIQQMDDKFHPFLDETVTFTSEDASSVVFRLGPILFRICMVLTAIRKYEKRDTKAECYCDQEDFESSLKMIEVFLQHSNIMFESLPKNKTIEIKDNGSKMRRLLDALPDQFNKAQADAKADELIILKGTVGGLLRRAVKRDLLKRLDHGIYQKVK